VSNWGFALSDTNKNNYRQIESSVHTDFAKEMSYSDYLQLETLFSCQTPLSREHDEMLFIVVHQASELWLKLMSYELASAINNLKTNKLGEVFKVLARV